MMSITFFCQIIFIIYWTLNKNGRGWWLFWSSEKDLKEELWEGRGGKIGKGIRTKNPEGDRGEGGSIEKKEKLKKEWWWWRAQ